jgi:hypothetical protein
MCPSCYEHFKRQFTGQTLGEYLDRFDLPVLAVDEEGRILASNQKMAERLGRSNRDIFGLLGGEAMECARALLPGGCGKTLHCDVCTIRMTVKATRETGEPQVEVPAYITRNNGQREPLLISTELRDGAVIITLHELPARAD